MSNYLENKLIDQLFRGQAYTFPSTLYIGLFTAAPSDTGGGTEVSGNGYARASVACSLSSWAGTQAAASTTASTGSSGTTSNNAAISFATPSGTGWGNIVAFGVFDALSGGNLLLWGAMTGEAILSGNSVLINPAALAITLA